MRAIIFLAMILSAGAARAADLRVTDAWIREAPPGAAVHGGFAKIDNPGATAVHIVGVESTAFSSAEMHEMSMDGGVMRMRALERVDIAAGARFEFAPGEQHLMLFGANRSIKAGEHVPVTLLLEGGARVAVDFEVRKAN